MILALKLVMLKKSSPICKMYAIASANIGTGSDSQFDSSKDKSELLETDIVLQCPGRGNDARSTTTITANWCTDIVANEYAHGSDLSRGFDF